MSDSPREKSRRVPIVAPLTGSLTWDWRESYAVLLAFVVPAALWMRVPSLIPVVFFGLIAVGAGLRIRRMSSWWPLLRRGVPVSADTVETTKTGHGTFHLAHATGWRVHRGWFTGDVTTSLVGCALGEQERTAEVRGLPYTDGVILAHPDAPKAMCVSRFPFDLSMRDDGRWLASVPPGFWFGAAATTAVYGLLALGGVMTTRQLWF